MARKDRSTAMKNAAAILGRRGGVARRRVLTSSQMKDIASKGGRAKADKNKK